MSGIELVNVSKRFGQKEVLRPLNLSVAEGEFMVLVGPSGCGKTTVLRLVAGLEEVTQGRILVAGRDVTYEPPSKRDVAMVFQNYALYPHMTVRENLEFGLKVRKVPPQERRRLVDEVAALLEIGHLLDCLPRQLSGGQRQRVALGRAIVRKPAVFLFDEPLSNIDAKLRVQTRAEIARLQRRLGTTTLYVTHDQVEAMTLGHRIAVMRDGQLLQVGPPLEVYRRPVNTFVATFIGSPPMNLLEATWNGNGLLVASLSFPLPQVELGIPQGEVVILGIRPEHLRLALAGEPALALEVEVVEPMGAQTYVGGKVGGTWCVAALPGHEQAKPGTKLWITFSREDVCLFNAQSGVRIFP